MQNTVEENKELCKKYPFLYPRYGWSDAPIEDYDYSYTVMDEIPHGWKIAFGDMMMEEIYQALKKDNLVDEFRFLDIKEKWGSLTVDCHGYNDETDKIIKKYSHLSENICMKCGKPDVYMTNMGWYWPCCKECWEKFNKYLKSPYESYIEGDGKMEDVMRWRSGAPDGGWIEHEMDISDTANKIRQRWKERCENSK